MEIELEPSNSEPTQLPPAPADQTAQKALKLAKSALGLSVLGLGLLGFLLLQAKSELSEFKGSSFKNSLKDELFATLQPQLQALSGKVAALEGTVSSTKDPNEKIASIETRLSQFEVELQKIEKLRSKFMAMEAQKSKPKPVPSRPMALKKPKNQIIQPVKKKKR